MRQSEAVRSEINVTPLVDVCLVLLIIFMVVTPLIGTGADIDLPSSELAGSLGEAERLVVALDARGAVFVEGAPTARADLPRALGELRERWPGRPLVVKGDGDARYADVREVLRLVSEAGFSGAGLAARRPGAALAAGRPQPAIAQ